MVTYHPFFQISRGCHQGVPLSPYIFIICVEFLANNLRNKKKNRSTLMLETQNVELHSIQMICPYFFLYTVHKFSVFFSLDKKMMFLFEHFSLPGLK